jgi:hypothetical protein
MSLTFKVAISHDISKILCAYVSSHLLIPVTYTIQFGLIEFLNSFIASSCHPQNLITNMLVYLIII